MRGTLAGCLLALGLLTACDSKATASDPQSAASRTEQKSKEYESCGATMHCAEGLRCFDHTCKRTARSTVGDYYAARGAAKRAKGDADGAIRAYASALAQYDAEKLPLPTEIDCAYGAALAAGASNKEHAELGARVLHRCLLAAPVGSAMRVQALADVETLTDSGLDPLLLGASKTADLYLTKTPARPATDKLVVSATASPEPAKTFPLMKDKLVEPDIRTALVACWEQYTKAAKKDAMAVTIGLRSAYVPAEYEDEPGRFVFKVEPPVAMPAGPDATADTCVRQIVEPALKAVKIAESFTTKLTVTVK